MVPQTQSPFARQVLRIPRSFREHMGHVVGYLLYINDEIVPGDHVFAKLSKGASLVRECHNRSPQSDRGLSFSRRRHNSRRVTIGKTNQR